MHGRIEGGNGGWLSRWAIPVLERVAAGRRPGEADRALAQGGVRVAGRHAAGLPGRRADRLQAARSGGVRR